MRTKLRVALVGAFMAVATLLPAIAHAGTRVT